MDNNIQRQKFEHKIDIFTNLIKDLSDYNNIEGYDNQKRFTIKLDYTDAMHENGYCYNIKVIRGINKPEEIFNMRFVFEENIIESVKNLIHELINNKYFLYTSFNKNEDGTINYKINLLNDVIVEINLKNNNYLEICNEFEKVVKKQFILTNDVVEKNKDDVQIEKVNQVIIIMENIIDVLEKYNSIDEYQNKKPYKLKISNRHDRDKECYMYSFSLIRGEIRPSVILNLRCSIKDKKVVYDKLYDMLVYFKQMESFMYDTICEGKYDEKYSIYLKNSISIEFDISSNFDKNFYFGFYEATKSRKIDKPKMLKKQL